MRKCLHTAAPPAVSWSSSPADTPIPIKPHTSETQYHISPCDSTLGTPYLSVHCCCSRCLRLFICQQNHPYRSKPILFKADNPYAHTAQPSALIPICTLLLL